MKPMADFADADAAAAGKADEQLIEMKRSAKHNYIACGSSFRKCAGVSAIEH